MKFSNTLLTTASLVAGVLSAACNPLKETCDPVPALAASFKEDFSSKSEYFDELVSKGLEYSDDGLAFSLTERFDNPSIKSNFYMMFGKVEVVMKGATGQGIISSFYLQSDDLDEIDIELFGTDTTQFQSNYFSKGNTSSYTRGGYHDIPSDPTQEYLTYTIDWSKDSLSWAVNGVVYRTLYPNDPQGYPQSPMAIFAGIWAGGDSSNAAGTIEWAGGETTYGPTYTMNIKSLIVTDYSTGKEYEYSDKSGDWTSINAIDGQVNGRQTQADEDFEKLSDGEAIVTASTTSTSKTSTSSSASTSAAISSTSTSSTTSSITTTSSSTKSTKTTETATESSESTAETTTEKTTEKTTQTSSSSSSSTSVIVKTTEKATTSTEKTTTSTTVSKSATKATETAEDDDTTIWWTPTQTQWWTPTQTQWWTASTETGTATANTKTADTKTTGTPVPSTLATVISSSSSSSSSSSTSSSPASVPGSLDDSANSSNKNTPLMMFLLVPMVSLLLI